MGEEKDYSREVFGDSWVCEMATALLLIHKFSDTRKLTYNLGLTDMSGRALEKKNIPEKKRRKKMHTKTEEKSSKSPTIICVCFSTSSGVPAVLKKE